MPLGMLVLMSLYLFVPAYFANMAPEFVKWIPFKTPIWERKLGKNKTWRGLIAGTLVGGLMFLLQKWLFQFGMFNRLSLIDYNDFSIVFGLLLGFGAILGDSIGSYYKRKKGLKPGEKWIPWDQLDFVIGGMLLGWFIYVPKIEVALTILIVSPFLHILFSRIGYWLRIKKEKW